jgi:hypothetical protein
MAAIQPMQHHCLLQPYSFGQNFQQIDFFRNLQRREREMKQQVHTYSF